MKTAVISGGNSGVGKAGAMELALMGYRLIIHGRDTDKTRLAADTIKAESGNTNVDFVIADVSTLKGMKAQADAIKSKTDTIDALILSTGVILPKQIITEDGLEKGFVIQYLSRFSLVHQLMPELSGSKQARIIQVGAPVLPFAKIHFNDLALKNNFTMYRAMAQEMFANHLMVQEFAKRFSQKNILINMAYPGITADTGITGQLNFFIKWGVKLFGGSPERASKNIVYLAANDSVDFSGYYLPKPGKPNIKEKINYDSQTAEKLWDLSLELIKPILT